MDAVDSPPAPLADRVDAPASVRMPEHRDGVAWRPIALTDLDALLELELAIGRADHPHYLATREEFERGLTLGTVDLERDTLIAHDSTGAAIAWAHDWLPAGAETVHRVILMGGVHPAHRRRGLGTAVAAWQVDRGRQMLAETGSTLPGWLLVGADDDAHPSIGLFRAHGLEIARYYLGLHRELAEPIPDIPIPASVRLEPYRPGFAEATRSAKNDAFRDHWGRSRPTPSGGRVSSRPRSSAPTSRSS